ncbi:MAG: class II aldolase/adducin family protein [Candidatus Atribacteria bacterium]|nr:class II aldolase/adducin family protein [Candidatus Atribacteria bacterium]
MNHPKNIDDWKKEIRKYGKKCVESGYVTTVGGNISVRLDDHRFLITATTIPLDELDDSSIVEVDDKGTCQDQKKPSKETGMHLGIYCARSEINAIVHVHPIISTTLVSIDEPITPVTFEELYFLGDSIGICPQVAAGSKDLQESVSEGAKKHQVLVLRNHGCVAMGTTLKEAYFRVVKLERAAQATVIAQIFGKKIDSFPLLG